MAPPVAWQTHPPQRSPEVPVKGLRARPGRRPGHGRLGVAHTEVTGFTCRGAGRSPSGGPCLPRQRIKGFESRSEQDDSYICGSICDAERESHEEPARADHGSTPRPRRRPRRSARRPCFTSAKGPRWVRRSPALGSVSATRAAPIRSRTPPLLQVEVPRWPIGRKSSYSVIGSLPSTSGSRTPSCNLFVRHKWEIFTRR